MSDLHASLQDVVERTVANNQWRQSRCFNLIPSETTPSLLVKLCEISDAAGRYAEHRTFKGNEVYYYQGTDFIEHMENQAREQIAHFFDCSEASARLPKLNSDIYSGLRLARAGLRAACSRSRPADICVRMRASPLGTTGKEKPMT